MRLRSRRSPMQDVFDGLVEKDAARLRALLSHGGTKLPRSEAARLVTESANKRGRRA